MPPSTEPLVESFRHMSFVFRRAPNFGSGFTELDKV